MKHFKVFKTKLSLDTEYWNVSKFSERATSGVALRHENILVGLKKYTIRQVPI